MYNRDLASTRYSPLAQINTANVSVDNVSLGIPATARRQDVDIAQFRPGNLSGNNAHRGERCAVHAGWKPRGRAGRGNGERDLARYELKDGEASQRGLAYWPGRRPGAIRRESSSLRGTRWWG